MKRTHIGGLFAVAGISALTHAAYATQPPCATSNGTANTACGSDALAANTGNSNTAMGSYALANNTSGSYNTAVGNQALGLGSPASHNTGVGYYALAGTVFHSPGNFNTGIGSEVLKNSYGSNNSAGGYDALRANTSGSYNTAFGANALADNQTVNGNSAFGFVALWHNTSGASNTAVGSGALQGNTQGNNNTASGNSALLNNLTGSNNTAAGYLALYANTIGTYGTALGYQALTNSQAGVGNIGVGPFAGRNIVQGKLNIDIGSWGLVDESNTIRIGLPQYHLTTYIAGIGNSAIAGGTPVVVNLTTGQLGFAGSSERYKTEISTLGSAMERLAQLRPVSFHIKTDPNGAIQYGLIAEEVNKVYPELVIRDSEGKIQGVRYDELAPMLLTEVQKQQQINAAQATKIASLEQKIAKVDDLERHLAEMHAALVAIQSKDQLAAQR